MSLHTKKERWLFKKRKLNENELSVGVDESVSVKLECPIGQFSLSLRSVIARSRSILHPSLK